MVVIRFVVWTIIWSCCNCELINLHFTSHNCDEKSRTVTASKSYELVWNGQITPKLCSFSFSRKSSKYKVCFESSIHNIPSSLGNIKIRVKNYTRSSWVFDQYESEIKSTCVKNAYRLNVSIEIPYGYIEPYPKTYLKLEITASEIDDDDEEDSSSSFLSSGIGGIFFFIFAVFFFVAMFKSRTNFCECCREAASAFLQCKCLDGCDRPSCDCDCDCKDIFRPCGECCAAWAGCCAACMLQVRGNESANQVHDQQTEMDEISDSSQINTISASVIEQPPSYESIKDQYLSVDPTGAPPSYESVTGRLSPSAPKTRDYR